MLEPLASRRGIEGSLLLVYSAQRNSRQWNPHTQPLTPVQPPLAGEVLPAYCTLVYAPPEVVRAFAERREQAVSAAHDIWALGVMVFEALTQSRAISPYSTKQDIFDMASGDTKYPWEDMLLEGAADDAHLHVSEVEGSVSGEGSETCVPAAKASASPGQARKFLKSKARPAIEACLQRDPSQRPTAPQLLRMIDRMASATETML
jgi:serine/threonine protein kinase